jgi:6-phosphogluconolactonase
VPKKIKVFPSDDALITSSAQLILEIMRDRLKSSDTFTIALSGGKTPRAVFAALAASGFPDWQRVHFFWGDERTVPPSHADSNYRMAYDALLQHIDVPDQHIHRIAGEAEPEIAAAAYEDTLRGSFATDPPAFDLILLGLGDDGHTASLFPGTPAVDEAAKLVTAVFVAKLNAWRISLTYPVINNARQVIFIVSGSTKARIVALLHERQVRSKDHPASLVQPGDGDLLWLLDRQAAALLKQPNI